MSNYYIDNLEDYRIQIESLADSLKKELETIMSGQELEGLMSRLWEEFILLLTDIPYIGGKSNPLTENLLGAAYEMGFYRALEERGMDLEDISTLNRRALSDYTRKKLTPDIIKYIKKNIMTKENFEKGAAISQKREFDGDWVYEYVEPGEDDQFDFGINYRSCAIVDLYIKKGCRRFLPYVCTNDYSVFKEMDVYFERFHTIGNGACLCDFRFKTASADGIKKVEKVRDLPEFKA